MITCEVGPIPRVVFLHEGAGVDEEQLYVAGSQLHLKDPFTVPAPIPLNQRGIQLQTSRHTDLQVILLHTILRT